MPSDPQTTKPLNEKPLDERTSIMVAVYWPGEGYGGGTRCETMEAARGQVQELVRLGYGKPGKHPIRIVTKVTNVTEFELADIGKGRDPSKAPHGRTRGWAYFNPDTGVEWTKNHPVESGECPDATEIKVMTLSEFRRAYPLEVANAAG